MKKLPLLAFAFAAVAASAPCRADLQDEIQVYDDSIDKPHEFGLELHVNTTPSGRGFPNYPGEVPPLHGLRMTPEFSWGATRTLELGLYLPTVLRADGRYELAGGKLRAKWIPLQPRGGVGPFAGVNFELSHLAQRYSQSPTTLESRFIGGWRSDDWLLAVNPTFGFNLSPGYRGAPDFDLQLKVARTMLPGIAGGVELYSGMVQAGHQLPWEQQDNRIFLALDVDCQPWVFNFGVGYGLTQAADRWTVKAIFELPVQHLFGG